MIRDKVKGRFLWKGDFQFIEQQMPKKQGITNPPAKETGRSEMG